VEDVVEAEVVEVMLVEGVVCDVVVELDVVVSV